MLLGSASMMQCLCKITIIIFSLLTRPCWSSPVLLSSVYLVSSFSTKNGEIYLVLELLVFMSKFCPQSIQCAMYLHKNFSSQCRKLCCGKTYQHLRKIKCSLSVTGEKEIATKTVYLVCCHYLVACWTYLSTVICTKCIILTL